MSTKLNFPSADRDIFIRGDDAAKRVITIGQQGTFKDDVVIASENWSVSAAGVAEFKGNVTLTASGTSPSNSSGGSCEVFGDGAGGAATTCFGLTAIGKSAGSGVTSGNNNTFMGVNAGSGVSTANECVAIGNNSMTAANADDQIAIGTGAMRYSEGQNNIAIGSSAMAGSTVTAHTGQFNIAIGTSALSVCQAVSWNNIAIGSQALKAMTEAVGNLAIGKDAGLVVTTGGNNVFIGNAAGNLTTTGSSNIFIGPSVNGTSATSSQEFWLSYAGGGTTPLLSGNLDVGTGGMTAGVNIKPGDIDAQFHIVTEASDAVSNLKLEQLDVDQAFIDLEGTASANLLQSLSTFTTPGTASGHFRIRVNGSVFYVPYYASPTA